MTKNLSTRLKPDHYMLACIYDQLVHMTKNLSTRLKLSYALANEDSLPSSYDKESLYEIKTTTPGAHGSSKVSSYDKESLYEIKTGLLQLE